MYLPKSPGITTLGTFHFQDFKTSFDTEDLMLGILHIREKSSVVLKSRILSSLLCSRSTYCCYYNFPKHNTLSVIPPPA